MFLDGPLASLATPIDWRVFLPYLLVLRLYPGSKYVWLPGKTSHMVKI
jgi:hypothetical protein